MTYDDKKKFIIDILYIVTIAGVLYFVFKYLLFWILPFVIGFGIAYILKPIGDIISNIAKFKNRNKGVSILVISFFYVLIVVIVGFIIAKFWGFIYEFISILPSLYNQSIEPTILSINDWVVSLIGTSSPEVAGLISDIFRNVLDMLASAVSSASKTILLSVTRLAQRVPIYFITFLFSIICSVLITVDYDNVSTFIIRQVPGKARKLLFDIKKILVGTIFKMIRAYFILSSIAFIEMCIGFTILGINNAISIAAFAAFLDFLPLIGVGAVLIPWGIYEIIMGQRFVGIGLLILYIILYIVRSTLEPRVLGKQIGLNSLVTIVSMFVGFKIFGFIGFIIAPMIAIVVKQLNDNKKINIYR